ncbi:MAG: class I mannose-6-phosphate isomerase [Prevotella sp.]|nr:class I mannose-6-phosphate isomerase [Prevotella sp.]
MSPIKFKPILKHAIWGGNKIIKYKKLHSDVQQIGESWEVSGIEGSESIIADGEYTGRNLNDVLSELKERLIGKENYRLFGDVFPLLVKFIDAAKDLSIQVHPNEEMAKKYGLRNGKTEMWFIVDADPSATLLCGLKGSFTPEQYREMVENDTICDMIKEYPVKEDDCFYIPAGSIHSIGKGCFLAEIQQTSDVTYRIYDYKRKDENGNYRELHTKEAAECIDFTGKNGSRIDYTPKKNVGVPLVSCPFFNTAVYDLSETMTLDYSDLDSFVILIGIKGEGKLTDNEGNETALKAGETMLIPATTKTINVTGMIKFLETYV